MNPLLCQLSYGAVRAAIWPALQCTHSSTGDKTGSSRARPVARQWAMTLLIEKTGRSSARLTPPMIAPIVTIMIGSM